MPALFLPTKALRRSPAVRLFDLATLLDVVPGDGSEVMEAPASNEAVHLHTVHGAFYVLPQAQRWRWLDRIGAASKLVKQPHVRRRKTIVSPEGSGAGNVVRRCNSRTIECAYIRPQRTY